MCSNLSLFMHEEHCIFTKQVNRYLWFLTTGITTCKLPNSNSYHNPMVCLFELYKYWVMQPSSCILSTWISLFHLRKMYLFGLYLFPWDGPAFCLPSTRCSLLPIIHLWVYLMYCTCMENFNDILFESNKVFTVRMVFQKHH